MDCEIEIKSKVISTTRFVVTITEKEAEDIKKILQIQQGPVDFVRKLMESESIRDTRLALIDALTLPGNYTNKEASEEVIFEKVIPNTLPPRVSIP